MSLPDFLSLENGPIPGGDFVRQIAFDCALPKSQKEIRIIENRKVHQIHGKDARNNKCNKPRKEYGLAKTCCLTMLFVLVRVFGQKQVPEVSFIGCADVLLEIVQIFECNIIVSASWYHISFWFGHDWEIIWVTFSMLTNDWTVDSAPLFATVANKT